MRSSIVTPAATGASSRWMLLIVMAKHGVNALRVKPAFNLRSALFLGCVIAAVFGFLQIAERVTWEGEEERAVFAGNSTAAPT